jgi:Ala-tRNA(Pro) deacylase
MTISPIYTTAPTEGVDDVQRQVFDALARLSIPFERVEHDWANTMADCVAVGEALGVDVCKNLVLCNRQKTQYYLLTLPGDKPFHTKDLSAQLGCARLSFASAEDMESLLRTHPGSASILSLIFDTDQKVRLVMDRETWQQEYFSCHPCESTGTLKLRTKDVLEVFLPSVEHTPTVVDLPRYEE